MEFKLYTADFPENTRYLNDCFALTASSFKITPSYFGCLININNIGKENLKNFLCRYLFDFYLREFVLSKIYDEYYFFNTNDASFVLSDISDSIDASFLGDLVGEIIRKSNSFNSQSFVLFYKDLIMPKLYEMTDVSAQKLIGERQLDNCVSVLKTYKTLSFNRTKNADVEFGADNECTICLDNLYSERLSADEVLGYLLQNSPEKVTIKNKKYCPELAEIISEVFDID